MPSKVVGLHRWDEIALEKVTEMLSRKIVSGEREMIVQVYVKRGCLVPMHSHESEQMTYVLQGALKFLVGGEDITVRDGAVLHIPSGIEHRRSAGGTVRLDLFSPIRQIGWTLPTSSAALNGPGRFGPVLCGTPRAAMAARTYTIDRKGTGLSVTRVCLGVFYFSGPAVPNGS